MLELYHSINSVCAQKVHIALYEKHLEARDRIDFDNAIPTLSEEARRWLRDAIETTHPGHQWLNIL